MVLEDWYHIPCMKRHNAVYNSDGCQVTIASSGTTHDFNSIIFQVLPAEGKSDLAEIGKRNDIFLQKTNELVGH